MFKKLIYSFFLLSALTYTVSGADMVSLSESSKRKFDYFFYEGLKLKNSGDFDAAFDLFNHCLAIDPNSSSLLYELADFYLKLNRPQAAVNALKKAVKNSPDNFSYKIALAGVTRELRMYGEAVETYEELIKQYPNKVELNFYLAEALTQQGEIAQAIKAFDALETSIGMNEGLSLQKYNLYMALDEPENAMREIEKLAEKFPMESRYQIILGNMFLEKKETEKAFTAFQNAYKIDPEDPQYIVAMSAYYEEIGDKDAAEAQIMSALVNEKLDVETKVTILSRYMISLQQKQNGIDKINDLFEVLVEQHPEDNTLKLMYGELLSQQNKNEEAVFLFQLVTEMEPENIGAWLQLLNIALKTENIPEVIRICQKGIELFPESPEFYLYLGIGYYQDKNYPAALEAYNEGIKNVPHEQNGMVISNFYGQIGDIYYQMEQMDNTFQAYEKALMYNDKNVFVLNNYAYFLALAKKDLAKAERMSGQTVKLEPKNPTYLDTYAWIYFMQGNYSFAKLYIEQAISLDDTGSTELVEHYGDILFMTGNKEKALEQWKKAKEMGKESEILDKKIADEMYYEDTNAK